MTKKEKKETKKVKKEIENDIQIEEIQEEKSSFKKTDLKKKLEECQRERQEYLDGWQRSRAEVVNLKKNHEEEKKLFTAIGKEKILEDLIPILDNFNAAFKSPAWEKVDQNWRSGIEYIYQQFQSVLENNNIQEFGKVGDDVDYKFYEVIEEIDGDEGKVVEIIQKGYKIGEKVLRPAKVKAGKEKKEEN